jgi:hypothetical protein
VILHRLITETITKKEKLHIMEVALLGGMEVLELLKIQAN